MNIDKIIKLADKFYSLAGEEKLPPNSENLDKILSNIESLETYKARIDYAEKNLKRLSSGSSRIVFLTPEKTVVKLAQNDKGIAQNVVESNPKMKSKYLNEILKVSKSNAWIEVRFLDKITEKEFEKMTGLNFKNFGECLKYSVKSSNSSRPKPKNFDEICDNDIIKEMARLYKEFKILTGDIVRISSWGSYKDKPVLIDSGLSKKVYDEFYDSKSSSSS